MLPSTERNNEYQISVNKKTKTLAEREKHFLPVHIVIETSQCREKRR